MDRPSWTPLPTPGKELNTKGHLSSPVVQRLNTNLEGIFAATFFVYQIEL